MNIIEGLQEEMDWVREIIKTYEGLEGNAGVLAAAIMKLQIKEGEKAIATGDVVEIIRNIQDLRGIEL